MDANDEYLSNSTRNADRNYQATVSGVSYGRIRATVRNTEKKISVNCKEFSHISSPLCPGRSSLALPRLHDEKKKSLPAQIQ